MVLILAGFFLNRRTPKRGINYCQGFLTAWPQQVVLVVAGFWQHDPNKWLETLGLAEYKANFWRNHIKTVRDMEALKSFTEKEIREDLHITKPGTLYRARVILFLLFDSWNEFFFVFVTVFLFPASKMVGVCFFKIFLIVLVFCYMSAFYFFLVIYREWRTL